MSQPFWWEREDLQFHDGRLKFAGHSVDQLAKSFGSPTFVYSAKRVSAKMLMLHEALRSVGFDNRFKIYYAMKANRFAPLLTYLKQTGLCGVDCCSPAEVEHAISCGFSPKDVSFTATNLSNDDLKTLLRYKDIFINCDSLSTIRRIGEQSPGRDIGIRINPAEGVGYGQNEKLQYCGAKTTKFGIYKEQFSDALALAKQHNLTIKKIHFHTGCGYSNAQLSQWDSIIESCHWFINQIDSLESVNVGGGLGVRHQPNDEHLDLNAWANILAKYFVDRSICVEVEPGDFVVKDSGLLLLDINTVETKRDKTFVGVNAGFNIAIEPAMYGLHFEPAPAVLRAGAFEKVSIAGNINEALDIFCHDVDLPPLEEDDTLVLINSGGYSSSMSSNHCMRGSFKEVILLD